MGYAPVKSDPWKARLRRRRQRVVLWSAACWRELCEQALRDVGTFDRDEYPISPKCLDLIREFNESLEACP